MHLTEFNAINSIVPTEEDYHYVRRTDRRNRYCNVIPLEATRVILTNTDDDYINANYVDNNKYICTQGPLNNTIKSFWTMVWQQNTNVILMLCDIVERNRCKSTKYWPQHVGEKLFINNHFTIHCLSSVIHQGPIVISKLRMTSFASNQSRIITHIWYKGWKDHDVPCNMKDIAVLRALCVIYNDGNGPIVTHCSAGIGRTGTFVLIDKCMRENVRIINVMDVLLELRTQRAGLVQTLEQYIFAKKCLAKLRTFLHQL